MSDVTDVPSLVPARMVNEAAYCSRLFYLEWVQGRFTDNADTAQGSWVHRRVDSPTGAAPPPEQSSALVAARSVMISSADLGLVAKMDLLEGDDGVVVPVDYKKGVPPANPERSWEPERVQLCIQGLILRDNGYRSDHGVLWYDGTRERVDVVFTAELVDRTLAVVSEMRALSAAPEPPPPLVDSPKCQRCSLVGLCLPDEHNFLSGRRQAAPRRLMPSDAAGRPLYVTEPGAVVGVRRGRMEVTARQKRVASVRPIDVSQVCVFGNVQVTTQALRACFEAEVLVCYFSGGGWLQGVASGLPSKHVQLRQKQYTAGSEITLELARAFIVGKVKNARTLARRNGRPAPPEALSRLADAAVAVAQVTSLAGLLGMEGAAARTYFQALPSMLRPELSLPGGPFTFEGRNRRPPKDAVNALLSFVYALIVKDLTAACIGVGLDPYCGLFHRPRFGRPSLALDLAEEFRPLIGDSVAITLINNGEMRPSHFVVRAGGVALTSDGRKIVLANYERRMDAEVTHPLFGYRITYRRVLEVQVRLLAARLMGEVPAYVAFTTR